MFAILVYFANLWPGWAVTLLRSWAVLLFRVLAVLTIIQQVGRFGG